MLNFSAIIIQKFLNSADLESKATRDNIYKEAFTLMR